MYFCDSIKEHNSSPCTTNRLTIYLTSLEFNRNNDIYYFSLHRNKDK